jgi:uncharacterized protein (TIGR00251 family)
MLRIHRRDGGITFTVRVVPRASSTELIGEHDGALKIRIAAPPVEGAANRELIRFLAKTFKVPQRGVEIVSGANSKNKIVRVNDADTASIERLVKIK